MSIITQILTAPHTKEGSDEVKELLQQLSVMSNNTGFVHESVWMDDERKFTRSWFAWANSYFAFMIYKLLQDKEWSALIRDA
jgi:meiotically up-regulated gene 157 (Mug157) protein